LQVTPHDLLNLLIKQYCILLSFIHFVLCCCPQPCRLGHSIVPCFAW
jgi:hypothetical protein